MKFTVITDCDREEEIVIYAHQRSKLIDEIESLVKGKSEMLNGYLRGEIVKLDPCDVFCFTVEDGKVYAVCENEKYLLKIRIYQLQEMLDENFIKINQSSIANIKRIKKFDASVYGTLKVIFKNGYIDYVSRRNIKTVKERLGL